MTASLGGDQLGYPRPPGLLKPGVACGLATTADHDTPTAPRAPAAGSGRVGSGARSADRAAGEQAAEALNRQRDALL